MNAMSPTKTRRTGSSADENMHSMSARLLGGIGKCISQNTTRYVLVLVAGLILSDVAPGWLRPSDRPTNASPDASNGGGLAPSAREVELARDLEEQKKINAEQARQIRRLTTQSQAKDEKLREQEQQINAQHQEIKALWADRDKDHAVIQAQALALGTPTACRRAGDAPSITPQALMTVEPLPTRTQSLCADPAHRKEAQAAP